MGSAQKFTKPTRSSNSCGGGISVLFGVMRGLSARLHIEVSADNYFVVIAIKRSVKCWIAIVRRIEKHCRYDHARTTRRITDRAKAPILRVTMEMAFPSSAENARLLAISSGSKAAIATCSDRFRGKQNRMAQVSSGLRVEANLQSFVRRATAPK